MGPNIGSAGSGGGSLTRLRIAHWSARGRARRAASAASWAASASKRSAALHQRPRRQLWGTVGTGDAADFGGHVAMGLPLVPFAEMPGQGGQRSSSLSRSLSQDLLEACCVSVKSK